jgi:hypothetical protein
LFGIQNLEVPEVPEFRGICYIKKQKENFGTLKNVLILEVSGF